MSLSQLKPGKIGPSPQRPPQPYSLPPTLDLDFNDKIELEDGGDFSGFDLSDQSDRIEAISPFQTTTYSAGGPGAVGDQMDTAGDEQRQAVNQSCDLPLHSHNCSHRTSPSTLSTPNKSKTSEIRLFGVMTSVKSLESELQVKDSTIKRLESEAEYKASVLESLRCEASTGGSKEEKERRAQNTLNLLMRRKEREMDKRIKELEEKAEDDKRTIKRLKQMNKQLLTSAESSHSPSLSSDQPTSSRRLSSELNRLHMLNAALAKRLTDCESRLTQVAVSRASLISLMEEFSEKAVSLAEANSTLTQDLHRLLD